MYSVSACIDRLIGYAEKNLLLSARDENLVRNNIIRALGISYAEEGVSFDGNLSRPDALLNDLKEACIREGVFEPADAAYYLDVIMGELSLLPSAIQSEFDKRAKESGDNAMRWFYGYCVGNDYVKRSVLDKNPRFDSCGLVVTINKAKPEFRDPKKAVAGNSVAGGYPKCTICRQNEGFAGRNKCTLRTVDIKLGGKDWFWQFSPYGYFNEHGIAVNCGHIPMHVDKTTFYNLMEFVDIFPRYFVGCNAPLPRIGGSVLAHDHYQGGGEVLPLHKAEIKKYLKADKHPAVTVGILDWKGTVIRVSGKDKDEVAAVSEDVRAAWDNYDNPALGIISKDENGVHNSISPTVIKTGNGYEMNIILRSNITSEEYPDGVFHAHPEFHIIKKESIGLIEAQGLFILPGRLEEQLARVEKCVEKGELDGDLKEFSLVYEETEKLYKTRYLKDIKGAMRHELGDICQRILENTAVFKEEKDLLAFLEGAGLHE